MWISGSTIDLHFSSIALDHLFLQRYIKWRDQAHILYLKVVTMDIKINPVRIARFRTQSFDFRHFLSNSFVTDRKILGKLHCFLVLLLYLHNLLVSESYVMTEPAATSLTLLHFFVSSIFTISWNQDLKKKKNTLQSFALNTDHEKELLLLQ